jgi:hypothetical protein
MEPFSWSAVEGGTERIASFGDQPALVCYASGPPERLPLQNRIGCLMVGQAVAQTSNGRLMCGAVSSLERSGDDLLWVAHSSAATSSVTGFRWSGSRFLLSAPTYEACLGAPRQPVQDARQCARG